MYILKKRRKTMKKRRNIQKLRWHAKQANQDNEAVLQQDQKPQPSLKPLLVGILQLLLLTIQSK